ncbi:hypothetical protein BN938_1635 [Mucinivorans hirudinis]|uniref:Uncharacterized protein n=1 Tax=Mucinivorans hirudinis TaxID=1433126 RepID=A0A060R8E1_9BACT|nr:hypothetical protein BN938_1635 [Mucinivorans hirudinis]
MFCSRSFGARAGVCMANCNNNFVIKSHPLNREQQRKKRESHLLITYI